MTTNDIEYWRNQYNEAKNDWNFLQLCSKMNYGDAIWYVEEQKIFEMNFGNEPITMYKPEPDIIINFKSPDEAFKYFINKYKNKNYACLVFDDLGREWFVEESELCNLMN